MGSGLNLVSELERLASALGAEEGESSKVSLPTVADRIAKALGVRVDEVAILNVSQRWRHLHFLVPEALKNVGYIPITSTSAIAARTARESRPEIINNFPAVRHATVFEGIRTGVDAAEVIQKLVSAPILADGRVVGVIQVSRKGSNALHCGPDFTADDLGKVLALCKPLGKLLQHVSGEKESRNRTFFRRAMPSRFRKMR